MSPPSDKKMVGIQPAEDSIDLSLTQDLGRGTANCIGFRLLYLI